MTTMIAQQSLFRAVLGKMMGAFGMTWFKATAYSAASQLGPLPTPSAITFGAGVALQILPFDEERLDVTFYNNGGAGGNVYLRDKLPVTAADSFLIPPAATAAGAAVLHPRFPPQNPIYAAGDAAHDLRIVELIGKKGPIHSNLQQ